MLLLGQVPLALAETVAGPRWILVEFQLTWTLANNISEMGEERNKRRCMSHMANWQRREDRFSVLQTTWSLYESATL